MTVSTAIPNIGVDNNFNRSTGLHNFKVPDVSSFVVYSKLVKQDVMISLGARMKGDVYIHISEL